MKITGIILAAGKGTRMNDDSKPKVMFDLNGKPLVDYCIENLRNSGVNDITLVVGYKQDVIRKYFGDSINYAEQKELLGTGHAVMSAKAEVEGTSDAVLVRYGDMPLYTDETLKRLINIFKKEKPTIAMLSVIFEDPVYWAYGRIIRNEGGDVEEIIEQKDCNKGQLKIKECNPGFYMFDAKWLWSNIEKLKTNNAQGEYYLTDMIGLAKSQGKKVVGIPVTSSDEALGINTPEQLQKAEGIVQNRAKKGVLSQNFNGRRCIFEL